MFSKLVNSYAWPFRKSMRSKKVHFEKRGDIFLIIKIFDFLKILKRGKEMVSFDKNKTPHKFQPHCTPCYNRTLPGHSSICFLEKPRQVGTNYRLSVRKDPGRDAMKTSKTEISRGTTFLNQPAWFELTWVQDRDDTQ